MPPFATRRVEVVRRSAATEDTQIVQDGVGAGGLSVDQRGRRRKGLPVPDIAKDKTRAVGHGAAAPPLRRARCTGLLLPWQRPRPTRVP